MFALNSFFSLSQSLRFPPRSALCVWCVLSFVLPSIIIRCFLLHSQYSVCMDGFFCFALGRYTEFHTLWIFMLKNSIRNLDVGTFFHSQCIACTCTYTQNMCAYIPMLCCRFVANDHRQLLLFYPHSFAIVFLYSVSI